MASVLIVEDRSIDRKFLATLLRREGHTVTEASDGHQALAMLGYAQPDLVISDILMPTVDGSQLVRRIREIPALARTPVMFYTATYHEREARALAQQCGVVDILTKPSDSATLLAKVRSLLDAGSPVDAPADAESAVVDREHPQFASSTLAVKAGDLERTKQRMAAVVEVAREIAVERDPQRLLARVCSAARHVTLAQHAVLGVVEESPHESPSLITSGIDQATVSQMTAVPGSAPPIAEAMGKRSVVRQRNAGGHPDALGLPPDHPAVFSLLQVPVESSTRVYGWLSLRNKLGAEEFSASDEEVAVMLSTHAGIAYENARLYEEARLRAAELEQEIAERKRVEEVLRKTQDRTEFALGAAGISVWEWDMVAERVSWSKSTPDILGDPGIQPPQNRAEFLGLVHEDDREVLGQAAERAINSGTDLLFEFRRRRPDGLLHRYDTRARVLRDAAGRPLRLIGVSSDITAQRVLEEQLRQSQKMEAIGQLAGGIAHDFNNMLTAIMGYAQFIAEAPGLPEQHRGDLDEIVRAGQRAAALTRQLLAFSRKQVLQPVPLDLNAMIRDTKRMLQRLIGEHIELQTQLAADLAPIHADPSQVEQILLNLAVNARDAMPSGGRLLIETAHAVLDESYTLQHIHMEPGQYVVLAVSDSGTGLDPEAKRHLFEPFFTTKPAGQGTGLGLATVYGIVKQSGGSIWVHSEPGEGTTFKVYLPRADGLAKSPEIDEDGAEIANGSEAILVVEDERAVRLLMCAVLRRAGYTVLEAGDPRLAASILDQHAGAIDLLITDVVMPGFSGPMLFEQLATGRPRLKVLYVSGYTDNAIVQNGRLGPGVEFLQKPFNGIALTRKVREVLDR